MVTEGVKQENSKSRDCLYKGTSSLEVVMTEDLDGAVFLCATSAELGENTNPNIFDKVELQLHRKYILFFLYIDIFNHEVIFLSDLRKRCV